jgi:hypothetical protein
VLVELGHDTHAPLATDRAPREVDADEAEQLLADPLLSGRSRRRGGREEFAAASDALPAGAVGEEPVVADADEALVTRSLWTRRIRGLDKAMRWV